MRLLRRIAGFLGFAKDDAHDAKDEEENADLNRVETQLPRRGFGVPVKVPVDRAQLGPVVVPCTSGEGGVQGLRWYARRLRIDEDGDVADEFLDEVLQERDSSAENHDQQQFRKFEVKYSTRPAKVRDQALSLNGRIQQYVEHQGRLQWV